jgi:hypothetical protein
MLVISYSCEIFGSHDLSKWIGVQKAKVESISQVPQPINVNQLQAFLGLCNY